MIRPYRGVSPTVPESAFIDPSAVIIGDVTLGERASVWCNATLRGDVNAIRIGNDTNIQDNSVLHGELNKFSVHLGERVTVGHAAVLHGCVIEDDVLVGIGAIVLNGARIGAGSVIAAGSLVPEGMEIPPRSLVMGVPAKVRREVTPEESARFAENNRNYLGYREQHMADLAASENQQ